VRTIVSQLSEAEVLGDTSAVRRLTDLLASRAHIPAKVLIFHEDTRPGYFGTFTRSSTVVGPRRPFAKDAIQFDYNYDSGEEWEEEEEGGEDLMSADGDAEDGAASEADSDMDGWLVDDDDDIDPGTPLSERAGSPPLLPLPELPVQPLAAKRKSTGGEKEKKEQKKRKVVPLVPFTKGPFEEERIGKCQYEAFKEYRIQFFNGERPLETLDSSLAK
jgi:chromatin assembly factor 1 subunit A